VRPILFDGVESLLFFSSFGGSRIYGSFRVLPSFESTLVRVSSLPWVWFSAHFLFKITDWIYLRFHFF